MLQAFTKIGQVRSAARDSLASDGVLILHYNLGIFFCTSPRSFCTSPRSSLLTIHRGGVVSVIPSLPLQPKAAADATGGTTSTTHGILL
jgi:hypothetical protein